MSDGRLPIEVELVFELMPCYAQRTTYGPGNPAKHPRGYFRKWGTYHGYDYETAGPPPQPGAKPNPKYEYLGRGRLVPEMLSGCRKAPIMAVGINPNLPGWWPATRSSVRPSSKCCARTTSCPSAASSAAKTAALRNNSRINAPLAPAVRASKSSQEMS